VLNLASVFDPSHLSAALVLKLRKMLNIKTSGAPMSVTCPGQIWRNIGALTIVSRSVVK